MNETQIIEDALKSPDSPIKLRRKVMHEIDSIPFEEHDEVTASLVKQRKRQKARTKPKKIVDWKGREFLQHIKQLSDLHGIIYSDPASSVKARELIFQI